MLTSSPIKSTPCLAVKFSHPGYSYRVVVGDGNVYHSRGGPAIVRDLTYYFIQQAKGHNAYGFYYSNDFSLDGIR